MSVLGRLLVSSAERLDLPDLLSIDSYGAGDWKYFLKGMVGDTKPFILKGFDVIDPANAIGTQGCSIRVADSVVFYPGSSAGAFFHGLQEGHPQAVPVVPELRKNAVNYVYLTFSTFNTSLDTRAFWDPDKDGGAGGEFTQDVNTESVLKVEVNVSTASFPANTIPIAKITVGPVVITAIQDARDLMFRLGAGGIAPNPFNTYGWRSIPGAPYQRSEPPTTMVAGGVNPFQGADKNIQTMKEWMDAVMSKLRELGGTTYWYDDTSTFGIVTNFYDAVATAFKSKGKWLHDTTTPGLLTWTEDIHIKMTSDPRTYVIRQGSRQLADEQVMYIPMVRNQPLNPTDEPVQWTASQPYINTIGGAVGLFANLSQGDYVRKTNDTFDKYLRVEEFYDAVNLGGSTTTAALARSVRLSGNYLGSTGPEKGRFDKGEFQPGELVVSDRDDAAIAVAGGNFHWLALRSDTIENIGSVVTTSLSLDIDQHDGSTARVTSAAPHGLVDGDRVTITGTTNYNGTFQVEVETANIFYITLAGGPFGDESGNGYYATVTTAARSTPYGFQEESANHGFNSNETISIAGTTNYDGDYKINVTGDTTFTIAVSGPAATETDGTATLARVIVRTEGSAQQLIQGQVINIGGNVAENIRLYLGMNSLAETAPNYSIPPGYNTLDGMQNYNGEVGENITARVSKLTAMMADKAQDKAIKVLPSPGIVSINNTTNGAAQEVTFSPAGGSLNIMTPGSDGQAFIALPSTAPGYSLLINQAAYVEIDRNNPTSPTVIVANIVDVPIGENIFVIGSRLAGPEVYMWDGQIVEVGSVPGPGFLNTVVKQNQMLKLVGGGTWSWDENSETLTWDADAFMQVPGLDLTDNEIPAGSIVIGAGEVAYVDINRTSPGGTLTVVAADNSTLVTTTDMFIIARRTGNDVLVGNSFLLKHREFLELDGALAEINRFFGQLKLKSQDTPSTRVEITGADINKLDTSVLGQELAGLLINFEGAQIDFETGSVYAADGVTPLGEDFVPAVIGATQYRWYSVSLVPADVDLSNRIGVQVIVVPADADGATADAAPRAAFGGLKKLGQVVVQQAGAGIADINMDNIVQLGVGSGTGGGAGVIKARIMDPVSTSLPAGVSYVGDGVTAVDGDFVLFTNLNVDNNQIYEIDGVGTSITWKPVRSFGIDFQPTDGDEVRIQEGNAFADQLAVFNGTNFLVNDTVRYFDGVSANFWEQSSIKSAVIANNTTGNLFTVTSAGSENFIISYSVFRGTGKATGQLILSTDGTNVELADYNAVLSPTGVTFSAAIVGPNLELNYISNNTGAAGTMKYFVKRWSNSAGGPSGIPSYSSGGGGDTPAAGNISDIQYKGNDGNLAGDSRFQWDSTAGAIDLDGLQVGTLKTFVIADNQVAPAPVFTYSAANFKHVVVEYGIDRGVDSRTGTYTIANTATLAAAQDSSVETGDLGVTFSVVNSLGTVTISYTSTNTGSAGSLKYSLRSWN